MKTVDIKGLENLISNYEHAHNCGCNYQCGCGDLDVSSVLRALKALITEKKEVGMLTADQARKKVDLILQKDIEDWVEKAAKAIEVAVDKKLYIATISYSYPVYEKLKKKLESFGYIVSMTSGGCGSEDKVVIKWG